MLHQVLAHLFIQMPSRRLHAGLETFGDRILRRVEGPVGPLAFGEVEADMRQ
jgi:hypothetical protein